MFRLHWLRLTLLALCGSLVLAGCAAGDHPSNDSRRGVFYGGVSGGFIP